MTAEQNARPAARKDAAAMRNIPRWHTGTWRTGRTGEGRVQPQGRTGRETAGGGSNDRKNFCR